MSHFRFPFRPAAGLLAALAVFAALPARGQAVPSDSVLRGFQATGEYILLVNGQADNASEVFVNQSVPAYLILPTALSPILITPGSGTVATVPKAKIIRQKDGTVDLMADAEPKPQGKLVIGNGRVDFTVEGKKAALSSKPPLLGPRKAADLKQHSPEYVKAAKTYAPNATSLAALKKEAKPVRVRVFFGSWCGHCKEVLPHILRVEDEIRGSGSKIQFDYHGIPKDFRDPEFQRLKLGGVPTGIVYVNGREVGRLETNDWNNPEVVLARLLGGTKTGK